jgi:hypothetical protein
VFAAEGDLSIQEFYIETDEDGNETVYTGDGQEYDTDLDNPAIYEVATTTVAQALFDPVGSSFGLRVSEGTIFQLGHFLYVDDQLIVVSKYIDEDSDIDEPNDKNIGFIVDESIVNSQIDESLLDNANGSPNEQAPGADRLMLVPRLTALNTEDADNDKDFFTLIRYQFGAAVYVRDVSEFNSINEQLARRTYETHGDYVTAPFTFEIDRVTWNWDADANTETANVESDEITAVVGPGVAYIRGYRVENKGDRSFRIDEIGDDETERATDQPVSLPLGGYYRVTNANGHVLNLRSMQTVNLLNAANTVIGSAVLRDFSGNRVYFIPGSVRMSGANTWASVNGFKDGAGATGKIYFNPASVGRGIRGLVYPMNMPFLKDTENYRIPVRSFSGNTTVAGNGTVIFAAQAGETLNQDSLLNLLVINAGTNQVMTPSSANVSGNQLVLNGLTASANARIYYNATITPTNPVAKTPEDIYVKVRFNSAQVNYNLGIPDCFKLLEVIDENGGNFTNSFTLAHRQRPNFYDHSYIAMKSAARLTARRIPPLADANAVNILTVKVRVWRHTPVSNGTFFTVDSYAGYEDELYPLTPVGWSTKIDLRDCIDFRPSRIPLAAYANNAAAATIMANNSPISVGAFNTQLFANTNSYIVPAFGTTIYLDYNYYLNRTDVITVDNGGNFTLVKGTPDKKSVAPTITGNKSVIAEVYVPGRPALTSTEAIQQNKAKNEVLITPSKTTATQTMRDIKNVSEQVDRLTYYTTLSMVEQATRDLAITDGDGNNRFKNGIIVDTFQDFTFADVDDPAFDAGLDWGEESLVPAVDTRQLDLRVSGLTNISTFGDDNNFATLGSNALTLAIQQPYATNYRVVSSSAFSYRGTCALNPNFSQYYNYWTRGSLTRDLRDKTVVKETPKLQKYIPVTSSKKTVDTTSYGGGSTSTTEKATVYVNKSTGQTQTRNEVASGYITNQWMRPFMAANIIRVRAFGLRPNTRHYFYFDRSRVNAYVRPAKLVNGKFTAYGKYGAVVKTDKNGVLRAEFRLPGGKFYCGSRWLYVMDSDGTWDNANRSATSKARRQYTAYAYAVSKSGSTPSLRQVEKDFNIVEVDKSVTTRTSAPQEDNSNSPMAQTFFVKRAMAGASECIYAAAVDLHFKRKSKTNGVTIDIREVVNGFPTTEILTGSIVHKEPNEVVVSSTGTGTNAQPVAHTRFTFDNPIRLDVEKEYAIVVTADADDPDYQIFTSLAGRKRLDANQTVNQDWGSGNLFASTNGTAWKPYPSEDLKFRLYRYNFNASSGTLQMKTGPYEFISLADSTGEFDESEMVYAKKGSRRKLTCNASSDRITGVGANTSGILVGDYIYVVNHNADANTEVSSALLKVDARINSTTVSVENPPPWSITTANSWLVVAGKLQGYDPDEPMMMTIADSSARANNRFLSTDTLEGLETAATGSIDTIDNIVLSYGQLIASKLEDSTNVVNATMTAVDPLSNTPYNQTLSFKDDNFFTTKGGVLIRSHSNDLNANTRMQVNFNFRRTFNSGVSGAKTTSTPILDVETATINAYTYRITPTANATSNFVTLPVTLAEGFEAEDFRLWITAHRPVGTQIKAYIRCKNVGDGSLLVDNPWIQLEMTDGASYFSPITNRDDFKEFVFEVPASAMDGNNVITYTNDQGVFHGFSEFALKIELSAPRVNVVPRLLDIRGVAFE